MYVWLYLYVQQYYGFSKFYLYKYAAQIHSLWLYINFKLVFCLAYQDFLLLLTTITMMTTRTMLLLSIGEKYNKIFHLQHNPFFLFPPFITSQNLHLLQWPSQEKMIGHANIHICHIPKYVHVNKSGRWRKYNMTFSDSNPRIAIF